MPKNRPKNYEIILDPCSIENPWTARVVAVVTIRWQHQKFVISDDVTPNDRPYLYIQLYNHWDDSYDYAITRDCRVFYSINGELYDLDNDEHKGLPIIKEAEGSYVNWIDDAAISPDEVSAMKIAVREFRKTHG